MKSIGKVIKLHPHESLLDDSIHELIKVRVLDVGVITRESALNMLTQFFKTQSAAQATQ